MIRDVLLKHIEQAITSLGLPNTQVELNHPTIPGYGDYSSNIALRLKNQNLDVKSPREIAEKVIEELEKDKELQKVVSKIEIAGPGFINFWLSNEYLVNSVRQIVQSSKADAQPKQKKTVILEFGQPNTHKLPHIGHFRSYTLGESLARILEYTGNHVIRNNYQGDVGLHVAKCLWGWEKKGFRDAGNLDQNIKLLQEAYQFGSKEYEESEQAKKEIDDINTSIYTKDQNILPQWEKTRGWSLDYYQNLNSRLGTKYDKEYFESQTAGEGKKLVVENTGRVFEKSQDAIIFPGEKYDLHNRVFITQKGNPTYEGKDLGLAFLKSRDFNYDVSLIATAVEQLEYFKVVYKAVEQIDPALASKFHHIPFGMVTLKGAKLSSRTGNIVSIEELLKAVSEELRSVMSEKEYEKEAIESVVEPLTIAASKYALLKTAAHQNIVFDLGESVALDGNSGVYLEYTLVRCKSVLSKAGENKYELRVTNYDFREEELSLLRLLYQFDEVVEVAAQSYSPHGICTYLFNLSQRFNLFYQKIPILNSKDDEKQFRLTLTYATSGILKKGLMLLGIPVIDRM